MPDKLKAAELFGKLNGWLTEKVALESLDTLTALCTASDNWAA
jgi:hypothetical protein